MFNFQKIHIHQSIYIYIYIYIELYEKIHAPYMHINMQLQNVEMKFF